MQRGILYLAASFAVGAIVGAGACYVAIKEKYKNIAQEEIDSVKEVFRERHGIDVDNSNQDYDGDDFIIVEDFAYQKTPSTNNEKEDNNVIDYAKLIIKGGRYTPSNYEGPLPPDTLDEVDFEDIEDHPHVIPPIEFGEVGYDMITLTRYADGVIADDADIVMEDGDIAEHLGDDNIPDNFGKGGIETDSLYVRNDIYKIDYELLASNETYTEYIQRHGSR